MSNDRISMYRQVRLAIYPSLTGNPKGAWSLTAITVVRGVPHTSSLDGGFTSIPSGRPGLIDIWDSIGCLAVDHGGFPGR